MTERNKLWFYLVLLIFLLWVIVAVRWYNCGIKGFCGDYQSVDRIENTILVDRDDYESPENVDFRPTETVTEAGRRTVRTTETTEVERVIECETYLNGFMKVGTSATASEVRKLENFLNDYEGENLDVNGRYEQDDVAAVNRFQLKYEADVLAPFGLKTPTGNVFSSTRNHINALHCAYNFDLDL